MSYSTFNGWSIIPMPASPVAKEVTLHQNDSVGQTQSPFTMQSQVQAWVGADWWELDVTLPPLSDSQARPWFAWLASLRGKANVFQMGDPMHLLPGGAIANVPVFNGAVIPGQTLINLGGLAASTNNILQPGDYLECANYLYMVAGVGPYNTDSSGYVTVEIWPSLRTNQNSGDGLGYTNTQGIWRLTDNKRSYNIISNQQLWTINFKAIEAR